MTIGVGLQSLILLAMTYRTNWNKEASAASERIRTGHQAGPARPANTRPVGLEARARAGYRAWPPKTRPGPARLAGPTFVPPCENRHVNWEGGGRAEREKAGRRRFRNPSDHRPPLHTAIDSGRQSTCAFFSSPSSPSPSSRRMTGRGKGKGAGRGRTGGGGRRGIGERETGSREGEEGKGKGGKQSKP
ncbi:hypothetical protein EJ110_NYTH35382 [Nymphaea thermarum]|nr:hypothetical protein EJ110_NYTH35382 [Nymphaea thermarum]